MSTAIIVINATRLSQVNVQAPTYLLYPGPNNITIVTVSCMIQGDRGGSNICHYVFVVCAVAMGAYIGTATLLCLTCNLCGVGAILELVLHLAQTGWWAAASITLSTYIHKTNDRGWPREGDRNAVLAFSWTSVPVAFVMAIFTSIEVAQWCRDYCFCCCFYRGLSQPHGGDPERQAGQQANVAEVRRKAEADTLAAAAAAAAAAPDFLLEPDPVPAKPMAPVAEVQLSAEPMRPPTQQVVAGGGREAPGAAPGLKGAAV
ncbi:hypothetical protein HYH02_003879 [Chlamydomonas schloesseri]|uniref:Uncharacterized protein n=1 Tax=Chlamydomonas schloesseri TaxID=2026947 RepID=A0A835WP52_9CHLO|nr:hypothetical protein HYH02_003879 [Chlamydomonas schloesseri]|eukprot:KAG2451272.1 hypothetical protein HYH02_003879 [Chlamydomonas schloesseri]